MFPIRPLLLLLALLSLPTLKAQDLSWELDTTYTDLRQTHRRTPILLYRKGELLHLDGQVTTKLGNYDAMEKIIKDDDSDLSFSAKLNGRLYFGEWDGTVYPPGGLPFRLDAADNNFRYKKRSNFLVYILKGVLHLVDVRDGTLRKVGPGSRPIFLSDDVLEYENESGRRRIYHLPSATDLALPFAEYGEITVLNDRTMFGLITDENTWAPRVITFDYAGNLTTPLNFTYHDVHPLGNNVVLRNDDGMPPRLYFRGQEKALPANAQNLIYTAEDGPLLLELADGRFQFLQQDGSPINDQYYDLAETDETEAAPWARRGNLTDVYARTGNHFSVVFTGAYDEAHRLDSIRYAVRRADEWAVVDAADSLVVPFAPSIRMPFSLAKLNERTLILRRTTKVYGVFDYTGNFIGAVNRHDDRSSRSFVTRGMSVDLSPTTVHDLTPQQLAAVNPHDIWLERSSRHREIKLRLVRHDGTVLTGWMDEIYPIPDGEGRRFVVRTQTRKYGVLRVEP